jgi:protein-disulfide isomerase
MGAVVLAAALLGLIAGATVAADPSPSVGPGTQAAREGPLPDLTMAPLVTLPPVVPSLIDELTAPTDGYQLGDPGAPVTVDLFEDFQCPYCQRFSLLVLPELVDAWVLPGHAQVVFHDFAFLGEESRWAAVAARLAAEQDRFWPFHDLLYSNLLGENVGSFTPDRLLVMGRMAGLEMDRFVDGLQVPAARDLWATIEADVRDSAATRGVTATPTVLVDGVKVATPDAASVATAIRAALSARQPGTSGGSLGSAAPGASVMP